MDPVTDIVRRIVSPLMPYTTKELHFVCKIFSVKVRSKNSNLDNKTGYDTILAQLARSRWKSEDAATDQRNKVLQGTEVQLTVARASTRKTRHCSFRLLNVIFSERFCDCLNETNTQPVRRKLGAGAVGDLNSFWKNVAAVLVMELSEYAGLVSRDARFYADCYHQSEQQRDAKTGATMLQDLVSYLLYRGEAGCAIRERAVAIRRGTCTAANISKKSGNSKKRVSEADTVIAFLESRSGSSETKVQMEEENIQENKRARAFTELEQLTKSLCAATEAGLGSTIVDRLESNVNEYLQKIEAIDA
ncbi:hypothetical protein PF001_g4284 [Phytophthora fragariae]|uniref:Uncharacterized protein n=1 Tax=Phytophthora fragariae TaxID=53985 RepID=A0A6A4EAI0_9STRA|nr:hypothetical protein PF001_g4284 [Phytophthora fragariae]